MAVQAEVQGDDRPFLHVEHLQAQAHLVQEGFLIHGLHGGGLDGLLQAIPQGEIGLPHALLGGHRGGGLLKQLEALHLLRREGRVRSHKLLHGRRPPQFLAEPVDQPVQLHQMPRHLLGQPDLAAVFREGMEDGLPHPPGGIG